MYACQYALLSCDRKSEPCSRERWLAHFNGGRYNPTLVREEVHGWQLELVFRGTWIGEGRPKFFSVSIEGRNHFDDRQEFATFEEACSALGQALEACRRSEAGERVLTATARKAGQGPDRNSTAPLKGARRAFATDFSAPQLALAARLDAKVQRLIAEGNDDVTLFVELLVDLPAFRRLLDAGPHAKGQLCRRFGGVSRYARILKAIAAGIASGEIRVPK